jgi:hypothetical protein
VAVRGKLISSVKNMVLSGEGLVSSVVNLVVLPVVVSAIFVFPSHKKQCVYLSKAYCYFLWEKKFLAVRRVGLMTRREYRVDRPFPVT